MHGRLTIILYPSSGTKFCLEQTLVLGTDPCGASVGDRPLFWGQTLVSGTDPCGASVQLRCVLIASCGRDRMRSPQLSATTVRINCKTRRGWDAHARNVPATTVRRNYFAPSAFAWREPWWTGHWEPQGTGHWEPMETGHWEPQGTGHWESMQLRCVLIAIHGQNLLGTDTGSR